jgi:hypothetical protein
MTLWCSTIKQTLSVAQGTLNSGFFGVRVFARARSEPGFGFAAKNVAEIRYRFSFWFTDMLFDEHLRILDSRFDPPESTAKKIVHWQIEHV